MMTDAKRRREAVRAKCRMGHTADWTTAREFGEPRTFGGIHGQRVVNVRVRCRDCRTSFTTIRVPKEDLR